MAVQHDIAFETNRRDTSVKVLFYVNFPKRDRAICLQ